MSYGEGAKLTSCCGQSLIDPLDTGCAWTVLQPCSQLLQRFVRPFRHKLHRSVPVVFHPAAETELTGLALRIVSERHALYMTEH